MPLPLPFFSQVVVVSSMSVVVLLSIVVAVGTVVVVKMVTVVEVVRIVGSGRVLVAVDDVLIEPPDVLVVDGFVLVTCGGFEVLVDDRPAAGDVDVVEPCGIGTPMPAPSRAVIVAIPASVVPGTPKTPMKSSRRTAPVDATVVIPRSSAIDTSAERTSGGSGDGGPTSSSAPA